MALTKYLCKCGYCGFKWVDQEEYAWKAVARKCTHCAEYRKIEIQKIASEGLDVFGYRFSPPFPVIVPVPDRFDPNNYLD